LTQINERATVRRHSAQVDMSWRKDMSLRTMEDIRRDLQWTRDQLAQRLRRIREDAAHRAQPLSADAPDRAQEAENDEVLGSLERSTQQLIGEYDHALTRLDQGVYGVCESCAFVIEPERLHSVPQATQCVDCANVEGRRAA
jgi:RNA polymerase-binding protein DksA